ncbi:hypothetical protein ACROYT_G022891 [Oculina patagonica]
MSKLTLLFLLITSANEVLSDDCRILKFNPRASDKVLVNHVIKSVKLQRQDMCEIRCYREPNCVSYNYGPMQNEKPWCDLNNSTYLQVSSSDFVTKEGYTYRDVLNLCLSSPCPGNTTCQTGFGDQGYRCLMPSCPQGYYGDSCQFDIKECIEGSHNCSSNAVCVDLPGSFQCNCKVGYTGNGVNCIDVKECIEGSHNCSSNAVCVDLPGSFQCNCKVGYTENGVNCIAVNDCSEAPQTTGIHYIMNNGLQSFPVYCDQTTDGGGWTMKFKVVGGVLPYTIGQLWSLNDTAAENVDAALDTTSTYQGHYKNRIVQNWQTFNPQEARVVLYTNGTEVASLKFSAAGTDNVNWFSQNNLVQSPWTDLKTATSLQAFSIYGGGGVRTFEISAPYAGCAHDFGWLLITKPICPWENRLPVPSIIYSKLSNVVNWSQYGDVGVAEIMIVYIR